MRVLIVGGTKFVGRHLTEAVLAAGHEVALLHRGRTNPDLFPQVTHLLADRNEDLSVLAGHEFDATVDVVGFHPDQITSLAEALGGRGGHYTFVSSVSAYAPPSGPGYPEDSPLLEHTGPIEGVAVTAETYGSMKVLCERRARELFGPDVLIVRPTYVVGPWDPYGRLGYWAQRLARGGRVLAPGDPALPTQVIDARDQAAWMASMLGRGGVFHTVTASVPLAELLEDLAREFAPAGTELVWVEDAFLLEHGVDSNALPLWGDGIAADYWAGAADPAAAAGAGLVTRPVVESARDLLTVGLPERLLTGQREAELLAAWTARS
ncbi:NAD-dependent epimerase/dehydratase family protein [Catellatospora sp. KI3]|uniref:NAD-dependent epimerase/dehydratase family protein n=1 Tax=Catellatospora sp. KI3 TaxID=3041620 RepID=UPI002482C641|nr:NAD-dependent epimerase/dehydratase family protein [Catellatospora sp. KI3]MDI1461250.1 NAD-dependent epimerase/dehydratase family protein [Catellatospora sp. KI3]